ncbi:MAG: hypothetical protein RLZZ435_3349, partial [Cyanobacteriota bacterium]
MKKMRVKPKEDSNSYQKNIRHSKYVLAISSLGLYALATTICHIIHWYQVDYFGINRIGSALTIVLNLLYYFRIRQHPQRLEKLMSSYLIQIRFILIFNTIIMILITKLFSEAILIGIYPPFTSLSFLWITMVVIFIPLQHLRQYILLGCLPLSIPISIYLVLTPEELHTARGMDLFISNSFITIGYIFISLFYAKLQERFWALSQERLNYYSKIIEEQDIRQIAIKDTFNQLHNGALQTLSTLRRSLETRDLSKSDIALQLELLNDQIRTLNHNFEIQENPAHRLNEDMALPLEEFYVACDKKIHLSQPLHLILREVYSASIARDFPYLTTLKFKIRSFDVLENEALSLELKRDIAFWLEEAICNVGKYAKNATRLEVK